MVKLQSPHRLQYGIRVRHPIQFHVFQAPAPTMAAAIQWLIDLQAHRIQMQRHPIVQHRCLLTMKCPSTMKHPWNVMPAMRIYLGTVILIHSNWTLAIRPISLPMYYRIAIKPLHSSKKHWRIMVRCLSSIAWASTRNASPSSLDFLCTNTTKTFCKYSSCVAHKLLCSQYLLIVCFYPLIHS